MSDIYVWPTLVGAIVLTRDAVGFGFFSEDQFDKLRADLESGVPLQQAVGFSGSFCPYAKLTRVYSKEKSPTIYVEAKGFLGKDQEDFTFLNPGDREQFFQTLLKLLGPGWHCHRAAKGGCSTLVGPLLVFLYGISGLACGGLMLAVPPKPQEGKTDGIPPNVLWILLGIQSAIALAGLAWFFLARAMGKAVWETVRKN